MAKELPTGWERCSLRDLGDLVRGVTYSKSQASSDPKAGYVGLLRAHNINGHLNSDDLKYVDQNAIADDQYVVHGDVVICMSSGSRSLVGKAAQAAASLGLAFGAFCAVFRSSPAINSRYVGHFLQTDYYRRRIADLSTGININNLRREHIEEIQLPLATRSEQDRIVDKIDELFSDIEGGERALERVRALLDRYRQAVLKAAVSGELTRDWREKHNGEIKSGEALLARILKVRREAWEQAELAKMRAKGQEPKNDQWKQKYEDPAPPQTTNLPRVPNGWAWSTLEMLTDGHEANGISIKGSDNPPGVVALRLDAIQESRVDYTARRYIPLEPQRAAKYEVRAGDFFISRANGSKPFLARAALAASDPPYCVFPDTVIRFRPIGLPGLGEWLQAIWPSRMVREQIERMAKTSAGIWKVSQDDLRAVLLPLPPLPEMAAAVERLKACQSEVQVTDADLRRVCDSAGALRQSILTAAFSGRLVAQDPSDELASVLLDRIRTERAATGKQPVKHRGRRSGNSRKVVTEPELPLG